MSDYKIDRSGCETDHRGTQRWFYRGERHREDGPAVIYKDGSEFWYQRGEYHRDDGPAVTWEDGSEFWYKRGKLHRDDGPAVIYSNGIFHWYQNGKQYNSFSEFKTHVTLNDEEMSLLILKYG